MFLDGILVQSIGKGEVRDFLVYYLFFDVCYDGMIVVSGINLSRFLRLKVGLNIFFIMDDNKLMVVIIDSIDCQCILWW